jgi:hypothetical protein
MNIERIAWFVVNGWNDPISIDVGVPQLQGWNGEHLLDGWHRLGAAIYRKDQDILATVDGSIEYCQELFSRTTIKLTQGYFATIDEEDFERVSKHKWYAVVERKVSNDEILNVYAYTHLKGGTKCLPLHRFLLGLTDPKIAVDHKDHNGLNNKKDNIRPTADQNQRNQRKGALNTSGYKGVVKSRNKWRAVIRHEKGKRLSLGAFSSKLEAARAYDLAAIKYHGEFANLNFPEGG